MLDGLAGRITPSVFVLLLTRSAGAQPLSIPEAASTSSAASEVLAPIIVSAPHLPRQAVSDPTARVETLDEAHFARARDLGLGLSDLVERSSGARLLDLGGPVHERRLSIRGGSATQTLVLVDGVPLHSPFASGLDLGFLGAEGIRRAQVVRGGAGAALGDGALSGALSIDTRPARDAEAFSAAIRAGSDALMGTSLTGKVGSLAILAELDRTEGDFRYISRLPGLPDQDRQRLNHDVAAGRLAARVDQRVGDGTLDGFVGLSMREAGVPGLETQPNLEAREQRAQALARAGWRRSARAERLGIDVMAHGALLDLDYDDPGREVASKTHFLSGGLQLGLLHRFGPDQSLRGGGEVGLESSRSTEHGDHLRLRASLAVSDELRVGAWTFFGALRGVMVGGEAPAILPRLGARLQILGEVSLSLALGRSMRAPSIDELYHPTEAGIAGNPALKAEGAWEVELGGDWSPLPDVTIGLGGFLRRIDGAILYVNQNAFVVRPENVGDSVAGGVEISVAATSTLGPAAVSLDAAVTLAASQIIASRAPLPGLPGAAFDLELVLGYPISAPVLELFTRWRQSTSAAANLSGTLSVEPYRRWDAGVRCLPIAGVSLGLVATNLLDERTLETLNKFPLPGRSLMATLRVAAGEP